MPCSAQPGYGSVESSKGSLEILTPSGRGAVAVLRVTTKSTAYLDQVVASSFQSRSVAEFRTAAIGRIIYGQWGSEDIVVVRTAQNVCELHCHGGSAAVSAIADGLLGFGISTASTSQPSIDDVRSCLQRLCVEGNGKPLAALVTSEVQRNLLQTPTLRTSRYLLSQLDGRLVDLLAQMHRMEGAEEARQLAIDVLRWKQFADHLVTPWKVLVLGRPNVGKSSLVNAVVGFERTIVFDQPGTTRDVIDVRTVIKEWPFELLDSAGFRYDTKDTVERFGMQNAARAAENCDACLLLEEASNWNSLNHSVARIAVSHGGPTAMVLTKCDLLQGIERNRILALATAEQNVQGLVHPFDAVLPASVVRSESAASVDLVTEWLVQTLIPQEPPRGAVMPVPGCISEYLQKVAGAIGKLHPGRE